MTWEQAGIGLFAFAIICEQGHIVSPIILAWSHPGLRRIALSRPIETMLLPVLAISIALVLPFVIIWWIYWLWNIYHFGAQHYGVISLWQNWRRNGPSKANPISGVGSKPTSRKRPAASLFSGAERPSYRRVRQRNLLGNTLLRRRSSRWLLKLACIGGTAVIMVGIPLFHVEWWKWLYLFAIDFNHWLVDISLSSRVSRYWWLFIAVVAALGCVGFAWKVPRADHIATMFVPWVIQARWGVGIAHFLYSRWVWKLSDPQIRKAIGF